MSRIEQLLAEGDLAWEREEFQAAQACWVQALNAVDALPEAERASTTTVYCELWQRVGQSHLAQGRLVDAQAAFERIVSLANACGDDTRRALALAWLSRVARQRRDASAALSLAERASQAIVRVPPGEAKLATLAMICLEQGSVAMTRADKQDALVKLQEARSLYAQMEDLPGEAACTAALGLFYRYMGLPDQAMVQYAAAAKLYQRAPSDPAGRLALGLGWGVACEMCHRYQEALDHYWQALDLAYRLEADQSAAGCLNNIAIIRMKQNEHEAALAMLQQAFHLYEKTGDRMGSAIALNNIGEVYINQGLGQSASEALEQSIKTAEEIDFKPMLSETYSLLSWAKLMVEQGTAAFKYAEKALHQAEQVGNLDQAAVAYRALGRVSAALEIRGHLPPEVPAGGPLAYFETSLEIAEQLGRTYEQARTLQAMGEYLAASNDPTKRALGTTNQARAAECLAAIGLPVPFYTQLVWLKDQG